MGLELCPNQTSRDSKRFRLRAALAVSLGCVPGLCPRLQQDPAGSAQLQELGLDPCWPCDLSGRTQVSVTQQSCFPAGAWASPASWEQLFSPGLEGTLPGKALGRAAPKGQQMPVQAQEEGHSPKTHFLQIHGCSKPWTLPGIQGEAQIPSQTAIPSPIPTQIHPLCPVPPSLCPQSLPSSPGSPLDGK